MFGAASTHALGAIEPPPNPEEEAACYNAVQCKLHNGVSTTWPEKMARALCERTQDWEATVECFKIELERHNDPSEATEFCRMENGASSQPAGEIRPLYVVNHTDKPQHFVVTGQYYSKPQERWIQTSLRDVVSPKSEKNVFMSLSASTDSSPAYGSIWVTTDEPKAKNLEAAVTSSSISLTALYSFLDGQSLSTRNIPAGAKLSGQEVFFDDALGIAVSGSIRSPVYLAFTGTSTATLVEKDTLYRARNPASVHDLTKNTPTVITGCGGAQPKYVERSFKDLYEPADNRSHDKGCSATVDGVREYHVRCEAAAYPRTAGRFGYHCLGKGKRKYMGREMASTPRTLEDATWQAVTLADAACVSTWATGLDRAHKKSCASGAQIYHARCERPDGAASSLCPDLPNGTFNGLKMVVPPKRLNKEWTEVSADVPECKVAWVTSLSRAHKKSCVSGAQVYHVRCERPDGSADSSCADMPRGAWSGMTMTAAPKRLNSEWTEVAVDDNACKLGWGTGLNRAHKKSCWQGAQIYHVRCERPDGSANTTCADLPRGSFNGMAMTAAPKRLNPEWTEVAVESAACR
ncbi:MAG TPA: hypothetical protein VEX18_14405 [Polyangiaceae bacterium]|nr:hypothetical protein [Polyangiaceae bacterium]